MLQQTRVAAVIPYYRRFLARFPDAARLAAAPLDEVLHLWSGLGYYARARNLHRAAREIVRRHDGRVPDDAEALRRLPGIGRTTAGAILALGYGRRHAILDGNVRRVLCRYHLLEEWPGRAAAQRRLWALAEKHTPRRQVREYTQAIMDLGALVCTPRGPRCDQCPLRPGCRARRQGRQEALPRTRPGRELPVRRTRFLLIRDPQDRLLMERRPPAGLWGGLWCLPECPADRDPAEWLRQRLDDTAATIGEISRGAPFRHDFSHFRLHVEPILVRLAERGTTGEARHSRKTKAPPRKGGARSSRPPRPARGALAETEEIAEIAEATGIAEKPPGGGGRWRWLAAPTKRRIGMAAPVKRLLERIFTQDPQIRRRPANGGNDNLP